MTTQTSITLFIGSFSLVFMLVMQQHAIHQEKYTQAFVNALIIGGLNLVAIRFGAAATGTEAMAFLCGGGAGTVFSMWVRKLMSDKKLLAKKDMAVYQSGV